MVESRIIDFHSHILPGIDDGSRSVKQSLRMMELELADKVSVIFATPHFYADKTSLESFLRRREEAFEKFMEAVSKEEKKSPEFHQGAEVYYFSDIGKASILPDLCVKDTNLFLLEMPFCQWTKDMYNNIVHIIERQHLRVMLAHIERYYDFQKSKDIWNAVLELPVYFQINAGSFLNWKKKRRSLGYLKEGLDIVLGTDCHNTENRVPNLREGREIIEKKLGADRLARIDELGERILQFDE